MAPASTVWRMLARGGLAAAVLLVAACAGDAPLGTGLGALTGGKELISEAQERELGAREHPKIVAAFGGVYSDPRAQAGIESIVSRLGRASDRPDIVYRVTMLNSPSVNAFALPGGFLYVTRGLLALANDSDELAAVLAHEMGHVAARHAAKRQNEALRAVLVGRIASVLRDPSTISQAMRDSESTIASFSRAQELEADQIGVEMAVKAGFDPYGAISFLQSMGRESDYRARLLGREKDKYRPDLDSSHPATPERIRRVGGLARDLGFSPGERARERSDYLGFVDGLLYGDDPREGFVRGRHFLHPGHRFAFSVPEGYSLQNAQNAVFAIGAEDTALRFDSIEVSSEQSLSDYVSSVWGAGAKVSHVREITINGNPAATAEASHQNWHYRMAAVRLAPNRLYRFLMAARTITATEQRDFDAMVASLRRLSESEAAELRPLRVRIVSVGPGDTPARLARRMAGLTEAPEERFRLINGLGPAETLKPGEKVKLIAE